MRGNRQSGKASTLGGYNIPAKSRIQYSIWVTHHSEEVRLGTVDSGDSKIFKIFNIPVKDNEIIITSYFSSGRIQRNLTPKDSEMAFNQ